MTNAAFGAQWMESVEMPAMGGKTIVCSYTAKDGTVVEYKCDDAQGGMLLVRRGWLI